MSDDMMTTTELAVIALARNDPLSSVMPPQRFAFYLFDPCPHLRLANPRLEALRRYAVLFRLQRHGMTDAERERIRGAGYDARQIEMIENLVAASRGEPGATPALAAPARQYQATTAQPA